MVGRHTPGEDVAIVAVCIAQAAIGGAIIWATACLLFGVKPW